jgi:inositol polyphosphate 5-phosphatase INPP5B/F
VNLQIPAEELSLREWLATSEDAPDIYAIGLQEIDMSAETIFRGETRPDYNWIAKIMEGLHPGDTYEELTTVRLVGMMLTVAVKKSLRSSISKISTNVVGTGTLKFGNKGGVGVSFQINETLMCFVNSHLAAHVQEFERRNEDHDEIIRRMTFNDGFRSRTILEHNQVFWLGDLNYRLTKTDDEQIRSFCAYEKVFYLDQLYVQKVQDKRVFRDFQEGKITFRPTYKYDPGTDDWDSSEKNRAPAWCDRILWKGTRIEQIAYKSVMELRMSDHKPVYGIFIAYILTRDDQKFKKIHEEVLKTVDKYENDNQPQITVAETDLDFGVIRFHELYSRELLVANNCHLPVHFQFRSKDDSGSGVCEDWIKISHLKGELITGNSLSIRIDIFIDESAASKIIRRLRDSVPGVKVPLDILVLHVENGRDIFITVFGEYQPSVFGLRLDTMMKLEKPLIEYTLKELVAIDDDVNNKIAYHKDARAPREIWLLTDYLYRNGLTIQQLFTIQRRHKLSPRICAIRDWLDAWSTEPFPGTPQSAAEALLKVLESLPEPLVTIQERELSIYASYFERCRELVQNKMPLLNRKIFLYIIMFLKEIQMNYVSNGLDDRTLGKKKTEISEDSNVTVFSSSSLQPRFVSTPERST